MTRTASRSLSAFTAFVLALMVFPAMGGPGYAQSTSRTFPETGKTVQGRFLEYWDQNGGLAQQGLPISDEMQEESDTNGKTYTVQYFERAVFEAHPENQAPYDVLLSLLGVFSMKTTYPNGVPDQQANTTNPRLFPETGKTIGGRFREYWERNGGLAQQGYPLTDEFQERSATDGNTYTVQYFERAVFELHPENAPPNDVLLSLLGRFHYDRKYAGGTPTRGGTVVIAATADPGSLNTAITTAGGTHFVADHIYNGLVGLDDQLNPQPELAASWEISEGGRVYTFKLQPNVRWHDDRPFTSADVKFTFEEVLLKFHARTKAGLENVLERIDAPSPDTVVFRFKQPYGPLLQRLDVVEAPIVAKHIYEGKDVQNDPANLRPVGTGPFKFVEYTKGDHVTLERNPNYFREGLPYLDRVIFRIIPDTNTATLALEQGEVDYIGGVQGSDIERLRANPDIKLAPGFGGGGGSLCQNVLIPNLMKDLPFNKLEVRQAFYMALDRQFIVDRVYFGQGKASTGPLSRQMVWAYTPDVKSYEYNVASANAMLDRAGYPRGSDGNRFTIVFTHAPAFARLGEVIREQLRQVGINFQLESMDVNAANEKVFIRKDFDMGVASYCNGTDPEIGVRRVYVSNNIGPILFSNGAGYKNTRVDQIFNEAAASTDREERARLYAEFQRIVVDDVPYFWIVDSEGFRAHRAEFSGFRYSVGPFIERVFWTKAGQ
ncbi:MAG TPA: ABC transporter substrate-binding protein [Chloroflexia bacterium]|nr:ABC transporter substrate-binding protein [Chloroflexia bacterium]